LLVSGKPRLLFVSPRFLLPADSGGKIRTGDILRGLKGGAFEVTLASPAPPDAARFAGDIARLCDHFISWEEAARGSSHKLRRMLRLLSALPIPVATDESAVGQEVVAGALAERPDVVVIDFLHAAVLAPGALPPSSVLFTHNVESEIFERQVEVATNFLTRAVWRNQQRKMARFERTTLRRFRHVVAVSERDRQLFSSLYGVDGVKVIATSVDLATLTFGEMGSEPAIVFTGSMDSLSNVDGVTYFMNEVWPIIAAARPDAKVVVVGRNPPGNLVEAARRRGLPWHFTNFVDDVRPYIRAAQVSVIPLRVGSGTRIKAFEAMALGSPVVSTTLGVEGLPLQPGRHYLRGDTAAEFAAAVLLLLGDEAARKRLARDARQLAEGFSAGNVAASFEAICRDAMSAVGGQSDLKRLCAASA
jgi:glycosyltransferase involved in cell wall biosynthesis